MPEAASASEPVLPAGPVAPVVPVELTAVVSAFATDVGAKAPGLLAAVHLIGSGAAGDWQPSSDVDLVFETRRPAVAAELAELAALHERGAVGRTVDGVYLTAGQIEGGPDAVSRAPQSVLGVFEAERAGDQLTWVTWVELGQGFRAEVSPDGLRPWQPGVVPAPLMGSAAGHAAAFCRRNLVDYWGALADTAAAELEGRARESSVSAGTVEWLALGPPRLVVTIERGVVVSKSAAGLFAAERWPWAAGLLQRVVAARAGAPAHFTVGDALVAVDLARACILSSSGTSGATAVSDAPPTL